MYILIMQVSSHRIHRVTYSVMHIGKYKLKRSGSAVEARLDWLESIP